MPPSRSVTTSSTSYQIKHRIIIGTRRSRLALWQSEYVAAWLRSAHPDIEVVLQPIVTHGDRAIDTPLPELGGKGAFTAELESALRDGEIDLAVHSFKDLPIEIEDEFTIGAVPERGSAFDALLSRGGLRLMALPSGAAIGTSSLRRAAQIKAARPDVGVLSLRGNVPTRIQKLRRHGGPYDAIVLAVAGLERLGMAGEVDEILAPEVMLPAPAQGALAVQCRRDDAETRDILAHFDHPATRLAVEAERSFLQRLGAGCHLPVGALATIDAALLVLTGRVCSLDGGRLITVRGAARPEAAVQLGVDLAEQALRQGAAGLLAVAEGATAV